MITIWAIVSFMSCGDMGLGTEVDLESPTLAISTPINGDYIEVVEGGKVFVTGIARDNIEVDRVVIIDAKNDETLAIVHVGGKDAEWRTSLSLAEGGQYNIKAVAYDTSGNNDAVYRAFKLDILAPFIEKAVIKSHEDGGISDVTLKETQQEFENLGYNLPRDISFNNIFHFQNEPFTISFHLKDDLAVSRSTLYIYDNTYDEAKGSQNTDALLRKIPVTPGTDGAKHTTPEWTLSQEDLIDLKPDYTQGKHYLYLALEMEDQANPVNTRWQSAGWICWWPETDAPHINIISLNQEGWLTIQPQSGKIDIDFYDDDELEAYYAVLIPKADWDKHLSDANLEDDEGWREKMRLDGTFRNTEIEASNLLGINRIKAGTTIDEKRNQKYTLTNQEHPKINEVGEYRLVTLVEDSKTSGGRWEVYTCRVFVQDLDAPIIMLNTPSSKEYPTPEEGSAPALTGGRYFNLAGYSIDNAATAWVKAAWIPAGVEEKQGFSIPNLITHITDSNNPAVNISPGYNTILTDTSDDGFFDGVRVWNLKLGGVEPYPQNTSYYMNKFHLTFDVLGTSDATNAEGNFRYSEGNVTAADSGIKFENKSRLFILLASDGSNTVVNRTFRVQGNETPPVIEFTEPEEDHWVHPEDKNLIIRFSASSPYGLGINAQGYKLWDSTNNPEVPVDLELVDGAWQGQIDKDKFRKGETRDYRAEAVDLLGNSTVAHRYVVIGDVPVIETIDASNADGTYPGGATITFMVKFSNPVYVPSNSNPLLKLCFGEEKSTSSNANKDDVTLSDIDGYATLNRAMLLGTTQTLHFDYIVPSNQMVEKLYTPRNPIWLPTENDKILVAPPNAGEAFITSGDPSAPLLKEGNTLQARHTIGINSVTPKITKIEFPGTSEAPAYYRKDEKFTIKLHADRVVTLSGSGKPELPLSTKSNGRAVFSGLEADGDGNLTILKFEYKVAANDEDGLGNGKPQWVSSGKFILYPQNVTITDIYGNVLDPGNPKDSGFTTTGNTIIDTKPPSAPEITIKKSNNSIMSPLDSSSPKVYGFNDSLRISLSGEANARLYYQINGGSAELFTGSGANEELTDKNKPLGENYSNYQASEYTITAYQIDAAGNRSPETEPVYVTIDSQPPKITNISCPLPDKSYGGGTVLSFVVTFSKKVKMIAANLAPPAAIMKIKGTLTDDTTAEVKIVADQTTLGNTLNFTWTIPVEIEPGTGDFMRNIEVSKVIFNDVVTDIYGNKAKTDTTLRSLNRWHDIDETKRLIVDARKPNVDLSAAGTKPAKPAGDALTDIDEIDNADTNRYIYLAFDEKVAAQTGGSIIIKPYYEEYRVPPVFTEAEFQNLLYYSGLKAAEQKTLYNVNANGIPLDRDNKELVDYYGNPLAQTSNPPTNFYKKTTQGLNLSGDTAKPDTSTKYVLNFTHNLSGGDVETYLKPVFEKAQWEWQTISSTSVNVAVYASMTDAKANDNALTNGTMGQVVRIKVPNALSPGQIWELVINENSFRDAAGNGNHALDGSYWFWSPGTSKPWVRVNRKSYNDPQYNSTETDPRTTVREQARPATDVYVRIDSMTPGASITYGTRSGQHNYLFPDNTATPANNNRWTNTNNARTIQRFSNTNPEATSATITSLSPGTSYTTDSFFFIGDGNTHGSLDGNGTNGNNAAGDLFTARKDYIKAVASRTNKSGGQTNSEPGYEGVFKTVVLVSRGYKSTVVNPDTDPDTLNSRAQIMELNIQGSDGPGTPVTSGFPIRKMDNHEQKFSRIAYRVNNDGGATGTNLAAANGNYSYYIWITHEILTPWYMTGLGWANDTAPLSRWVAIKNAVNGACAVDYGAVNYLYHPRYSWSNLLP
jgi:hypothetical protein